MLGATNVRGIRVVSGARDVTQFAMQAIDGATGRLFLRGFRLLLQGFAFLVFLSFQVLAIRLGAGTTDFAHFAVVDLLGLGRGFRVEFARFCSDARFEVLPAATSSVAPKKES